MNKERVELLFQYTKLAPDTKKVNIAWEEIEKELGIKLPVIKKNNEALVIFLMDTSGSMGVWEKHNAEVYYSYALEEIQKKFINVEEVFVTHDTDSTYHLNLNAALNAKINGGTLVSKGMDKVLKAINDNLDKYIYVFQFTDGDNLTSDCVRCKNMMEGILNKVENYDYVEMNQYNRHSTLYNAFNLIKKDNFRIQLIKHKDDSLKGVKFREVLERGNK